MAWIHQLNLDNKIQDEIQTSLAFYLHPHGYCVDLMGAIHEQETWFTKLKIWLSCTSSPFGRFFYYGVSGDGDCDQTLGAFSVKKSYVSMLKSFVNI